jgi:cysteine desulfuration protein SufE
MNAEIEHLISDFELLDDWEDRYRHLIELGRALPDMEPAFKTPATKVNGCASQVWIHSRIVENSGAKKLSLEGDSDALIVKGLIAVVFKLFSTMSVSEIVNADAPAVFARLGLKDHLTPQRSNGLASMVARIKADAAAA